MILSSYLISLLLMGNPNAVVAVVYPQTAVVTEVSMEENLVEVTTPNGESFVFEEAEDWIIGDNVNMIMSDNGTFEDSTDDIILSVRYTG